MNVLGIETSCDETAAALVRDGRDVLSSVVFSQIDHHRPYGGVVPELASRCHVEALPAVLADALAQAGARWADVDAVAVTYGPGLASALLVGLSAAKALALRLDRRLIGINHIEAHLYSVFLGADAPRVSEACPMLSLIVSGGHTSLVRVEGLGRYRVLGQTVDDAAGEAFDKGAKLLGLGYPGGPAIDRIAREGQPRSLRFPRGRQKAGRLRFGRLDPALCFSYSGLKTALLHHVQAEGVPTGSALADVAAAYQEAIVDSLVDRVRRAYTNEVAVAVCGGVSLNSRLRARMRETADRLGARFLAAPPAWCADNAAMVAGLAGAGRGVRDDALALDVDPSLPIEEG